jgi:hypothetical protein
MWTPENRARYDRSEPLSPSAKRGGNRRTVVMRDVVDGLISRNWPGHLMGIGDRRHASARRACLGAPFGFGGRP